jgi:hypothetical protein
LNITGENDPLGKRLYSDAFPNLTGDEREFVKTGINRTFDALFEDEDEEKMKMRMKIFLTTSTLE